MGQGIPAGRRVFRRLFGWRGFGAVCQLSGMQRLSEECSPGNRAPRVR